MKNQEYYASEIELLKKYSGQLNKMIEDGSFYCLPYTKRCTRIRQIKRLYSKLRGPIGHTNLISILAAASLLVLGVSCDTSNGGNGPDPAGGDGNVPSFAAPVQNPFGLTGVTYGGIAAFADLDGDGDLDGLSGEYGGNFKYFENTGTANSPAFALPVENPFGLTATYFFSFPVFADLDGDGDMDILSGEAGDIYDNANLQYFVNTGTANSPAFALPVENPFGLTATYYFSYPASADLDGDGDLDFLVGEYYANFQYFQNTGTANSPAFAVPVQNPFGLIASAYMLSIPAFADLDGDGDMDILVGENGDYDTGVANYYYFQNTGTANAPAFAAPVQNPFGLTAGYGFSFLTSADLDGDGDMDLLASDGSGNTQYYENTTQ